MPLPGLFISGIGTFVPEIVQVTDAIEQGLCTAAEVAGIEMTGAAVAGDIPAPEMALSAAKDALRHSSGSVDDIGLLAYMDVWHQGPDCWHPQYYLQRYLVGGDALAVELRQGCNVLFCAMELASGYMRGFPTRGDALLVSADNFGTPRMDRWRSAPFFLGDAAAALVLSSKGGFAEVLAMGTVSVPELEHEHRAGEVMFPPGATTGDPVNFRARENTFNELAKTDGELRIAWLNVHRRMLRLVSRVLAEADIKFDDISRAIFTNLTPASIEHRWMDILRLKMDKSTWDYGKTVGHTGASDPVLSLHHLLRTGQLTAGNHVVMGSVGSAGTVSCAVVRILAVPEKI
jgi:3-oxoacyl-[acyl-carrier-protein] synthase-3/clorobiocin biosynthesis protein CloN2